MGEGKIMNVPPLAKRVGKLAGLAVGTLGAVVAWVLLASVFGPLSMLVYTLLFFVGAAGIPVFIAFMAPSMPGVARKLFGDLNTVLMMIAANVGIMCQADDGTWHLRVGRDDDGQLEVWIDGGYEPVGNRQYLSRLGMRPFGILREKTPSTWKQHREDPAVLSDGGITRERARIQASPSLRSDDGWLVDFTSIIARLEGAGGIAPIDRAAEQEMRNQADGAGGGLLGLALITSVATMMGAVMGLLLTGAL